MHAPRLFHLAVNCLETTRSKPDSARWFMIPVALTGKYDVATDHRVCRIEIELPRLPGSGTGTTWVSLGDLWSYNEPVEYWDLRKQLLITWLYKKSGKMPGY